VLVAAADSGQQLLYQRRMLTDLLGPSAAQLSQPLLKPALRAARILLRRRNRWTCRFAVATSSLLLSTRCVTCWFWFSVFMDWPIAGCCCCCCC
jgi:hypothetical protein